MKKSNAPSPLIAENRKARFDYFIEDRYEAGLELQGWEVKSMRAGRAQLAEAYVYLRGGEAFLSNAVIDGRYLLRACVVNFHTSRADVEAVPEIVARTGRAIDAELRR